jgi:hypothetical protein
MKCRVVAHAKYGYEQIKRIGLIRVYGRENGRLLDQAGLRLVGRALVEAKCLLRVKMDTRRRFLPSTYRIPENSLLLILVRTRGDYSYRVADAA